ncbi:MAG TPA: ParB N-terminal domain-containing protein [Thermoplasmata archaeon]|nr:ParB N-terminal domain-containing protein [Thermoplasmata archaeon]
MSAQPTFELLPVAALRIHEEIGPGELEALIARIRHDGRIDEPILVARGSLVILNGHHRYAALQRLGASQVPAWVVNYDTPEIELDRWRPGPPITKAEVIERGRTGRPFPPKTTKHRVALELPHHPTPLATLMGAEPAGTPR